MWRLTPMRKEEREPLEDVYYGLQLAEAYLQHDVYPEMTFNARLRVESCRRKIQEVLEDD